MTRFNRDFIEELRERLTPSAIIGETVKLRRAGREFVGLSPFKQERTPSFYVNDAKGRWFDFAAGKDGDVIAFVMETRGLSFADAVETLAQRAGLPLPKRTPDEERREKRRATLAEANELAAAFYRASLARSPAAEYLAGRGVTAEHVEAFGIGYAPEDRTALKVHLLKAGVDQDVMAEAGLLIAGDDIPVAYDRFRHRVMFPIRDGKGRTIAFGGRALAGSSPAKYLNSPETPLFHKGRTLYNLHAAREARQRPIVVEGYFDTLSVSMAGWRGAVAPLGTALTPEQLDILWRMDPEPVVCFDGDRAGLAAAYRAVDVALPLLAPGRSLRFAIMPEGQDPDDVIRKRGRGAFEASVNRAHRLIDVIWRREFQHADIDSPERFTGAQKRIDEICEALPVKPLRDAYRHDLRDRLYAIRRRPKVVRANGHSLHSTAPASMSLSHTIQRRVGMAFHDAVVIAAAAANPGAALDVAEEMESNRRLTEEGHRLFAAMVSEFTDGAAEVSPALAEKVEEARSIIARLGVSIDGEKDAEAMLRDARH